MPSRKRKAPDAAKTKSGATAKSTVAEKLLVTTTANRSNLVQAVVQNAQANEAFHTKYIKELKQIYTQVRR